MEITEVRVKLVSRPSERLRAFCSITLDGDFVIRDLKIIGGANGAFVAMPSRKLSDRCSKCGCKNHLRAKFCNECGQKLKESRAPKDAQGRAKLHADVAHPINAACRERIQAAVIEAYEAELERSKSPNYEPPKYDDFEEEEGGEEEAELSLPEPEEAPAEAAAPSEDKKETTGEGFSDYNSLIADLKREAADRQEQRRSRHAPRPDPMEDREEAPADRGRSGDREPRDRVERPAREDRRAKEDRPVRPPRDEDVEVESPSGEDAEVEAEVEAEEAPGPKADDTDEGGFGAGLF